MVRLVILSDPFVLLGAAGSSRQFLESLGDVMEDPRNFQEPLG